MSNIPSNPPGASPERQPDDPRSAWTGQQQGGAPAQNVPPSRNGGAGNGAHGYEPHFDPRWQRAQQKAWREQQRQQAKAWAAHNRAAARAQRAAMRSQMHAQRQQWNMYMRGTRRASLVGPVLLISIGLLFFLMHAGHIAVPAFLHWYAQWWPLLLIAVGLIRLLEWGVDRYTSQPGVPVRTTIGGGVVFLLILIAVTGLVLHGAERSSFVWNGDSFYGWHGHGFDQIFANRHEADEPAAVNTITATGDLLIDSAHGDVSVAGTSDDGKLHFSVHKEAYTSSDSSANERLAQVAPALTGPDASRVLTIPDVPAASADVDVLVPTGVHVRINANHGDVRVNNLRAPVAVTANHGDVEIAAILGDVTAHVNHHGQSLNVRNVTGNVEVAGNGDEANVVDVTGALKLTGDFFGGGHLQHISGGVNYQTSRINFTMGQLAGEADIDGGEELSASEAVGPVVVNTRNRNVSLARVSGDVSVTDIHGDITVVAVPPTGSVTVADQNGNVNVTMPASSHFTAEAETSDGNVSSDFAEVSKQGSGVMRGVVNGGGPAVRISTSHGDVHLDRNNEPPIPPPPPLPKLTGLDHALVPPAAPAPPAPAQPPGRAQTETGHHKKADDRSAGTDW